MLFFFFYLIKNKSLLSSYVIQNFFLLPRAVVITPRFKNLLTYLFTEKIFFFYNTHVFFKILKQHTFFSFFLFSFHFKNLFIQSLFAHFRGIFTFFKTAYINNLQKSLIFHNLKNLNSLLDNNLQFLPIIAVNETALDNLYFFSLKVALFEINKKLYEKIFFLHMFLDLNLWSPFLQFFLMRNNFLKLTYDFHMYYFTSGFFFNIYNY